MENHTNPETPWFFYEGIVHSFIRLIHEYRSYIVTINFILSLGSTTSHRQRVRRRYIVWTRALGRKARVKPAVCFVYVNLGIVFSSYIPCILTLAVNKIRSSKKVRTKRLKQVPVQLLPKCRKCNEYGLAPSCAV